MSMKNSNDTIGNRNRDLPACSAMSQPNAPPRILHVVLRNCYHTCPLSHDFTHKKEWLLCNVLINRAASLDLHKYNSKSDPVTDPVWPRGWVEV